MAHNFCVMQEESPSRWQYLIWQSITHLQQCWKQGKTARANTSVDALNRIRICKITAIMNQKGTTILACPSWPTCTDDGHSFCVIVSHSAAMKCHRLLDMSDLRPLRLSSCLLHPLSIPYSQPGRQFTLISLSEPVQSFTNILIHALVLYKHSDPCSKRLMSSCSV